MGDHSVLGLPGTGGQAEDGGQSGDGVRSGDPGRVPGPEEAALALQGILMRSVLDVCKDVSGLGGAAIRVELEGPKVSERRFWKEAFITNWWV